MRLARNLIPSGRVKRAVVTDEYREWLKAEAEGSAVVSPRVRWLLTVLGPAVGWVGFVADGVVNNSQIQTMER